MMLLLRKNIHYHFCFLSNLENVKGVRKPTQKVQESLSHAFIHLRSKKRNTIHVQILTEKMENIGAQQKSIRCQF